MPNPNQQIAIILENAVTNLMLTRKFSRAKILARAFSWSVEGIPPKDPILSIAAEFAADPSPHKINTIVGAYRDENGEPNGVLEELAGIPNYAKAITPQSEEALLKFMKAGQEMALSYGYTTAQEGRAMETHELLAKFAEQNFWKLDVVSYVDYSFDRFLESKWLSNDYINRYRIGGLKLTLDGSPQGRTAWRTQPYLLPPDGANEDYDGYPAIPDDEDVSAIIEKTFKNKF